MGTAERRLAMLRFLCQRRHATMGELAERFGVSLKTIQRDIYEIESTLRAPLVVRKGKYYGGVYVMEGYSLDRMYMEEDELCLLRKIHRMLAEELSAAEAAMLERIIFSYTKPA